MILLFLRMLRRSAFALVLFAPLAGCSSVSDTEQPAYTVKQAEGVIELREYPAMLVAEVDARGDRRDAVNDGFSPLADFIFGGNTPQQKVAMTAPVTQQKGTSIAMTAPVTQQAGSSDAWKVRFIMPRQYTLATLPKPINPNVRVFEVPKKTVLAIRFSGFATDHSMMKHREKLESYAKSNNIRITGEPTFAYYNPPWTLPFLRRNEVWFTVE